MKIGTSTICFIRNLLYPQHNKLEAHGPYRSPKKQREINQTNGRVLMSLYSTSKVIGMPL